MQFICTAFKREHVLIGERYTHMHTGVREGTSKRQTSASASDAGERRGRGGGGETEAKIPPGDNGTVVGIFEKKQYTEPLPRFRFLFSVVVFITACRKPGGLTRDGGRFNLITTAFRKPVYLEMEVGLI